MAVSATTVRTWLRAAGLGPAATRGGMTWREFVRAHRRSMLAVDSSPSRRFSCNDCTCCSSSNCGAAVCTSRAARRIRVRPGNTASPSADLDAGRMPRVVPLPDSPTGTRNSPTVLTTCFGQWARDHSDTVSRAAGERRGGAVRTHCSVGVSRLAADPERPASSAGSRRLRGTLHGHRPHRALALTPPCPARSPVTPLAEWGEASCPASRSSRWCGSRVRPGGVIRFLNPTGPPGGDRQ